jgi:arylsulfatase A-like enzyme
MEGLIKSISALCCAFITFFAFSTFSMAEEFKGKIAKDYKNSKEWWPQTVPTPPKNAPNVVIILLDDVGFAQLGSFGGLINTPNMDSLAQNGLRYTNFHTAALCSPSRAAIMAGRNPHSIGLGSHSLTAMGFPGYNAIVPDSAKSVAKIMQMNGYVNYALGKWDHTPLYEVSQVGPFNRWPSGEGFQHYYGFMAADADQYRTVMWQDHSPIQPWVGKKEYHNSTDLVDKAITYITGHVSISPDRPFMVFLAPGAMHSPHQAPKEYIQKYKGKFDMGWDSAREKIFKKQKEMGFFDKNTVLSKRIKEIPAWDSLKPQEKKLYARQMEVFAAQLDHLDVQLGRLIQTLKRVGAYDNTLIIISSDNGASGEGGLAGTFNETYVLNGLQTPFDANMRHYEGWGGPDSYPHYHAGWAMAGNTPFKYFKQAVHRGGQSDPLIIHWPNGIKGKGELRKQYHHIIDIAPTLLAILNLKVPDSIEGYKQQPMDGVSMYYSFNDANAENRKKVQYYEMFGNRAIWKDGWKAVTLHGNRMPWDLNAMFDFNKDEWELYNLNQDPTETNNLAQKNPEKLAQLKKLWDQEAMKYNVYPLYDDMISRMAKQQTRIFGDRTEFIYFYPGAVSIAEKASPPVKGRSHTITTNIDLNGDEQGVIIALGGFTGGYTMFIKDNKLYYDYNYLDGVHYILESPPLPKGKTELKFIFTHKGDFSGIGELFVNGKKVDSVDMPKTHQSTYSLSEPFDIGRDNGTQVSRMYKGFFPFSGKLDKVIFNVSPIITQQEKEQAAQAGRDIEQVD